MHLECKHISKRYGSKLVLNDVSFTLGSSGLTLITGPNGSGKSTLLDILQGVTSQTSGEVVIDGKFVKRKIRAQVLLRQLQEESLYPTITVGEYLDFAKNVHSRRLSLQKPKRISLDEVYLKNFKALFKTSKIEEQFGTPMRLLSGGQRKLVVTVASLIRPQKILLLDEPFAGLSQLAASQLIPIIKNESKSRLIIVVDHELHDFQYSCDRVFHLREGHVSEVHQS